MRSTNVWTKYLSMLIRSANTGILINGIQVKLMFVFIIGVAFKSLLGRGLIDTVNVHLI